MSSPADDGVISAAAEAHEAFQIAAATTYPRHPPIFANLEILDPSDRQSLEARWQTAEQTAPSIMLFRLGEAAIVAPGVVWLPDRRLVAESLHNMQAINRAKVLATGPPPPLPLTHGKTLLLARAGSMNYGHWLAEHLSALLLLRDAVPELQPRPLVNDPRGPAVRQMYADSMRLAGLEPAALLPLGRMPMRVSDLLMLSPATVHSYAKHPTALTALARLAPKRQPTERLFVRRISTTKRVLRNLDAVEAVARRLGFRCIVPGQMSLDQQIEAFAGARIVVGVSGADLTNIVFMPEGGDVICLLPTGGREFFFWDICCIRKHRYWSIFGPASTDRGKGHDDFTVDVELAARIMARAISSSSA